MNNDTYEKNDIDFSRFDFVNGDLILKRLDRVKSMLSILLATDLKAQAPEALFDYLVILEEQVEEAIREVR